jgi:hypothetical protein
MHAPLRSLGAPKSMSASGSAFLTTTPLTSFTPDGPPVVPPSPKFTKDKVNGWIMGHHPKATSGGPARFQSILLKHHSSFAYSLKDMVGYSGHMVPMRIQLKPDTNTTKLFSPKQLNSPHEEDVTNKCCGEPRDIAFVIRAPHHYPMMPPP